MKVLVAGGTGAIGRPLIPQLVAAGHEVIAFSRKPERAADLEAAGATAFVCDALDPVALGEAVERAAPDAVIDQLTSLPPRMDPRKLSDAYVANDRIRREGSGALIEAAKRVGVHRYVIQSVAFLYAPAGGPVKTEDAPVWSDAPEPFRDSVEVLLANEAKVTGAREFTGIALRYGFLYGPGTYYASDGSLTAQIAERAYPIVGKGTGITSLVHVYDAAVAAVLALERGEAGIYNIVDDRPAPAAELIPFIAELVSAKPPRHVPRWLARIAVGRFLTIAATEMRGADNHKARVELGFEPRLPDWREGLRDYRDSYPEG